MDGDDRGGDTATIDAEASNRSVLTGSGVRLRGAKGQKPRTLIEQISDTANVIKTVLARAKYAADYRRPFEEEWHRSILAMFQVLTTERESSWQSQRYMPLIQSNVETAQSVVGAVLLSGGKLCRLQALTPEGRDNAEAHEGLLLWQDKGPTKIAKSILRADWWALVTGTGIIDVGWDYEEGDEEIAYEDVDGEGGRSKVRVVRPSTPEKPVVVKDHPSIRVLNPLNVYLAPTAGHGSNHRWYVERLRTTLGEVRASQGLGHIDEAAVKAWLEEERPTDGSPLGREFDSYIGAPLWDLWLGEIGRNDPTKQPDDNEDEARDDKIVELLVYRSDKEIITLGSPTRIIGYSRNPYDHKKCGLVTLPYIPVEDCPYGRGLAGVLLGHQELLNENVNLFADVMKVVMMSPVVVDRSLINVLDDEAILEPNAMLRARMNARDAVVPLQLQAPTNLFLLWDNHLKRDADDTGGYTDQARGVAPAGNPTATEFSGVQANIQNRLKIHVLRLGWFIEEVVDLVTQLNEQFYTQAQVVSITGDAGVRYRKIEPWEIRGRVLVQATISPRYANPDLHVQRQLQILQVLSPVLSGQAPLNPPMVKLLRGILRAAGTDAIDEILPAGMEDIKSPQAENEWILRGGRNVMPTPAEVRAGLGPMHIQSHQIALEEWEQNPDIPEQVKEELRRHLMAHAALEQQYGAAQAMAQQPEVAGAASAGTEVRQGAQMLGNAQGSSGVPGAASPGPSAPAGRPM